MTDHSTPIARLEPRSPDLSRPGFTLIEAVVSTLIVAGVFVAAMTAVAAVRTSELIDRDRARGSLLAQDLMEEVLQHPYGGATIGREGAETSVTARDTFDDADDYHAWTETPPQSIDGQPLAGFDGWTREVRVEWVRSDAPSVGATAGSGVKRITVRARRGERVVAELTAIRTDAWTPSTDLWKEP